MAGAGGRREHELLIPLHKAELECGVLRRPAYGHMLPSHNRMGVEYKCDDGYELHGPSDRRCVKEGSAWGWSPAPHRHGGVTSCRVSHPSRAPTASPSSAAPTAAPSAAKAKAAPIELHTIKRMSAECDTPTPLAHGFLVSTPL